MREKKTEFITMKVTPSFKARAKALAAEEGRSLSNYIEWLINNDMKQKEQEDQFESRVISYINDNPEHWPPAVRR